MTLALTILAAVVVTLLITAVILLGMFSLAVIVGRMFAASDPRREWERSAHGRRR